MFRPSRSRRGGPDAYLELKIALFSLGALVALTGIFLENRWVVGAAMLILAAGFTLRFRRSKTGGPDGSADAAAWPADEDEDDARHTDAGGP